MSTPAVALLAALALSGVSVADLGRVEFAQDSATLSAAARALLDRLVPQLKASEVRLEGHADRGEKNTAVLSLARARAVQRYLVGKGVPAARLTAAGYAATRPLASSATEAGRRQNRRVELVPVEE
jgi:outer membrane protein OmpA-like peptidoglycan-associated protein